MDVFDVLASQQVYKKAWALEDAMMCIVSESGRLFEPDTYRDLTRLDRDGIERLLSQLIRRHFYITA